jgi:NADPH-dependent 2,4-dienoyl-CoA reductase/sulfur reductase-like enzyme
MPNLFQFEIAVIGAGPAGLAAACVAAAAGRRVGLIDDTPWLGGQIWRGQQSKYSEPAAQKWIERFKRSGAVLLDRTSVIAAPSKGILLAEHPDGTREIQWQNLVVATGGRELFLPFPGWTLPGVSGPGGLQALVKHGWPIAGKKVVIGGSGPLLLAVADGLKKHGARIVSIAEQAPFGQVAGFARALLAHPGKLLQGARIKSNLAGVPYRFGVWPVRAEGDEQVRRVVLTDGVKTWTEECDALACGFGLVPNVELPLALGCALQNGVVSVNEWQGTSLTSIYCAGEPTGVGGVDCALVEGQIAGHAAAGQRQQAERFFAARDSWHRFRAHLAQAFALRPELRNLASDDTLLCRCEDVNLGRVREFSGWRDAKLQSRCGMGPCQGRICGAAAQFVLGWSMESVRPPVLPTRVESLISKTN